MGVGKPVNGAVNCGAAAVVYFKVYKKRADAPAADAVAVAEAVPADEAKARAVP